MSWSHHVDSSWSPSVPLLAVGCGLFSHYYAPCNPLGGASYSHRCNTSSVFGPCEMKWGLLLLTLVLAGWWGLCFHWVACMLKPCDAFGTGLVMLSLPRFSQTLFSLLAAKQRLGYECAPGMEGDLIYSMLRPSCSCPCRSASHTTVKHCSSQRIISATASSPFRVAWWKSCTASIHPPGSSPSLRVLTVVQILFQLLTSSPDGPADPLILTIAMFAASCQPLPPPNR